MNQQSLFRETIFALSSGALPSGVAVVRLSGPHVRAILGNLAGGAPSPRQAVLRQICDRDGRLLDRGLLLFFEGPSSFTGEDCAELHLHGGKASVAAVLASLASFNGSRMADAGEFTRRAFVNGKIDLTGAEALADLIAAETESQRQLALENAEGQQRLTYENWRRRLLHARAMIEAELDFADEGDVPGSIAGEVWLDLEAMKEEIVNHVAGYRAAEIVREGYRVVLAGAPNAGKSSLLNALARRDVAIVTDVPGTTRDLVEVALDLNGVKVVVTDTAGIRETRDAVERIGVERAVAAVHSADLVVHLVEPGGPRLESGFSDNVSSLLVATKADLAPASGEYDHQVSAKTGAGIGALIADLTSRADAASARQGAVPSRRRHIDLLVEGHTHLERAVQGRDIELQAEELRLADAALGRIIGTVDTEELLGTIFSQFCIGK